MRNSILSMFLSAGLLWPALSLASGSGPFKDSFGCQVLMCMSPIGGTPEECLTVLRKLHRKLTQGKPFPICNMVEELPPVVGDQGITANERPAPTTSQGVAAFIPAHEACTRTEYRTEGGRDGFAGEVCVETVQVEQHYEPDASCDTYFERPSRPQRDWDDSDLWVQCHRNSKKYAVVKGGSERGQYFYY